MKFPLKAFLLCLLLPLMPHAKNVQQITLEKCFRAASLNYPLYDQLELIDAANQLTQQMLKNAYLPQLQLEGQISYQSAAPEFPIGNALIRVPELSRDRYNLSLNINQLIYDAGTIKQQQMLQNATAAIQAQNVKIALYTIKEWIQTAYFNILLLKEKNKMLALLRQELTEKLKTTQAAVNKGALLVSDADILQAEIIKTGQEMFNLHTDVETSVNILSQLTLLSISTTDTFLSPEISLKDTETENIRPELFLFRLQESQIEVQKTLSTLQKKPVLSGFFHAGYGRPGLNFLSNDFEPFYIIGAKLSWKFTDWGNSKKERKMLGLRQEIIQKNRQTFIENTNRNLVYKQAEVKKYQKAIEDDEKLIAIRKRISKSASSQFDNGVISATQYLTEKNAEIQALLNQEVHKLQLIHAKLNYAFVLGNL